MPKHAPKIFQLFGVLMALNLVFLLAANADTNNYQQAALLSAAAASRATGADKTALQAAALMNLANGKKTEENSKTTKEPGRGATSTASTTASAIPTPGPTVNLSSVPDSLKDVQASDDSSSSDLATSDTTGPGGVLKLLAAETARIKKVNDDSAQRAADQTASQIADIQADFKAALKKVAYDAQDKADLLTGRNEAKPEATPEPKPVTLSDRIVSSAATQSEESKTAHDKLAAHLQKKPDALSLDGISKK